MPNNLQNGILPGMPNTMQNNMLGTPNNTQARNILPGVPNNAQNNMLGRPSPLLGGTIPGMPNTMQNDILGTPNNTQAKSAVPGNPNNMPNTMPEMPNNMMNNQNQMQNITDQNLENMFPDLYQKMKPHIDEIANQLKNQQITENMIDAIVDEILRRSGIADLEGYMDEDMEEMEDTLAVQRYMNYGRNPRQNQYPYNRRRRYPRYYNPSLQDLIRLMLMRQLWRNNPNCPYCY